MPTSYKTWSAKLVHELQVMSDDGDELFCEWWEVTDGFRSFRANGQADAAWLMDALNALVMLHALDALITGNGSKPKGLFNGS